MKAALIFFFVVIIRTKAWSSVRNPFQLVETTKSYHTISECMHVTSEEGEYSFSKMPTMRGLMGAAKRNNLDNLDVDLTPSMQVCGLYVVTDADKMVEITMKYMNVDCISGGLMAFVDGWELNGQYFPNPQDHHLDMDKRIIEFCNNNKYWPLKQFKRVYRSSQNAALLQYRIPIRGAFIASVRFIRNPSPCHVMTEGVSPIYSLINAGNRNNCTLTALYPAVVTVKSIDIGGRDEELNYDCDDHNIKDYVTIGGSSGLDSINMEKASTICGHSGIEGPEQAIFCGVTTVRLSSTGNYDNRAIVSIRPADESDLSLATLICQL